MCKITPFWSVSDEAGWIDLPDFGRVSPLPCRDARGWSVPWPRLGVSVTPVRLLAVMALFALALLRLDLPDLRSARCTCCHLGIPALRSLPLGRFFAVWDASPSREEALKAHGAASQWADVHWEVTEGFESP